MKFPEDDYIKEVCKIGQMHECCRYLTMSPKGWSCEKHSILKAHLDSRMKDEMIIARGDNCQGVPPLKF